MKLKIAAVITMVISGGCATSMPPGTIAMAHVNKIYTASDLKRAEKDAYAVFISMYGEDGMRGERVAVRASQYKSVAGDLGGGLAYVPSELRARLRIGDIVEVKIIGDDDRYGVVLRVNPPGCEMAGGIHGIKSDTVYCNGKRAELVLPK